MAEGLAMAVHAHQGSDDTGPGSPMTDRLAAAPCLHQRF